jgi:hypothetical protein
MELGGSLVGQSVGQSAGCWLLVSSLIGQSVNNILQISNKI